MSINIIDLGRYSYEESLVYQSDTHSKVLEQSISDSIIFIEHEPVYTLGKNADQNNILTNYPKDVEIHNIDRGGDVTYHGPGQLVGYPIINIKQLNMSIGRYVHTLEEILINTLKMFDLIAKRRDKLIGVWINDEKIASIGVRVQKGVTKHGFALNVNTDLSYYNGIIPCGIENCEVTVKLAGSDVNACLYLDEYSSYNTCDDPELDPSKHQITSVNNGYYEFWIGDETETRGYRGDQKFKIEWERIGVAHGMVDFVNILPLQSITLPLNITACVTGGYMSPDMNKLISDELGCKWDNHTTLIVENVDDNSVHGIEFVDVDAMDTRPNKIISNELGYRWDKHTDMPVLAVSATPPSGAPHGLYQVDMQSPDKVKNKVVSNEDLHYFWVHMLKSGEYLIPDEDADPFVDWVEDADGLWEYTIVHNLNAPYPHVSCYNVNTHIMEREAMVTYINANTLKITVNTDMTEGVKPSYQLMVKISG